MSNSYSVFGTTSKPTEKHEQMKAVWDACYDAGIEPPDEVIEFLDKDERGVRIDLPQEEESRMGRHAWVVKVKDIPKECESIVFEISW